MKNEEQTYSGLGDTLCGEAKCVYGTNFLKQTAVPIARTTIPDSPSRSKHCRYLT